MRDKKDFFSEETPAHHDKAVREAVQAGLRKNQAAESAVSWLNWSFTLRGLAVASVAALASYLVLNRRQQNEWDQGMGPETLVMGADIVSGQEIETIAESDFDFELLEHLELLEEMEDV